MKVLHTMIYSLAPSASDTNGRLGTSFEDSLYGGGGRYSFSVLTNILRFMYPEDEVIEYISNMLNTKNGLGWVPLTAAIIGKSYNNTWDMNTISKRIGLPLTKFFYTRGLATTYSDFTSDGIKLDFENRFDVAFYDNSHASRNHFQLTAKGVVWFGCWGHHYNDFHSTIYIDSIPQSNGFLDYQCKLVILLRS